MRRHGWGGATRPASERSRFYADLQKFYRSFFSFSPNVWFLFPRQSTNTHQDLVDAGYICSGCLSQLGDISGGRCEHCGFDDPEGFFEVEAPGLFLNAPFILERQLIAFCLDCWVEGDGGISKAAIPDRLKSALQSVMHEQRDSFPYTFIRFVAHSSAELFERFSGLFGPSLSEASRSHLRVFLYGAEEPNQSLERRVPGAFQEQGDELAGLKRRYASLEKEINRRSAQEIRDGRQEDAVFVAPPRIALPIGILSSLNRNHRNDSFVSFENPVFR